MAARAKPDTYASAWLIALVVRALSAERPELLPEGTTAPDPMKSALAAAGDKRGLLQAIHARAGAGPLLAIGHYLDRADETPTLTTLTTSSTPEGLAQKWMRLEGYHHASNRTRITVSNRDFTCSRHGEAGSPDPSENALIAGFLAGLCARAGATGVHLEIEGKHLDATELQMHADIDIATGARFVIGWQDWPCRSARCSASSPVRAEAFQLYCARRGSMPPAGC